jgi:hypothetical protein
MFRHSTSSAWFFSVLIAALIFSLSLAGLAAAQGNTNFGVNSLATNTTGSFNSAFGVQSLFGNTAGQNNAAFGVNALFSNTLGNFNTVSGNNALAFNTTGSWNTAMGFGAMNRNTGSFNTAFGAQALLFNTAGQNNTAFGINALLSNTAGQENTASGANALGSNTTGANNTASGINALFSNTIGANNTASGKNALFSNTGTGNIALGFEAGKNLTIGDNNIAIGNPGVAGGGRTIWLGDPNIHATTLLSGFVGIGTTAPGVALDVVGSSAVPAPAYTYFGQGSTNLTNIGAGGNFSATIRAGGSGQILATFFIATSDERIKNIQGRSDSAADLRKLLDIEVTDFRYKDVVEKGNRPQKKVIAQQVEDVYPQAVSRSTDVVPDIYQKAPINNGWVELATDLKVGDRVRLITEKGHRAIHEVLEVAEDKFRTDFAADGDVVFVYGREVKDFRSVDYEAIAMLNVSATQELNHRLEKQAADFVAQAEEMSKQTTRIAELEQDRQAQATRIAELEKQASEIAMLKQQMAALQATGVTAGRLDAARLATAK